MSEWEVLWQLVLILLEGHEYSAGKGYPLDNNGWLLYSSALSSLTGGLPEPWQYHCRYLDSATWVLASPPRGILEPGALGETGPEF